MKEKNKIANEGGINGTGIGFVNTNSKDFKGLQVAIITHFNQQAVEQKSSNPTFNPDCCKRLEK